ncbi:MAG: hypothetical protein K8T91_01375 [Planctomycetes bacterium]|nr:hypothetical protein [Planctomycetota bacterium]
MRAVIASALGLLAVGLAARTVSACSCIQPPPPQQAMEASSAVFTGKVVEIQQGQQQFAPKRVTFEVDRSYKGLDGGRVEVTTAADGAMCGFGFQKGKSYLVYCYGDKESLNTNLCTRTKSMENAGDDLKELGEGKKP